MSQKILQILNNRKILALIFAVGGIFWGFSSPVMAVIIMPGQSGVPTTGAISLPGAPCFLIPARNLSRGTDVPPGDIAFTGLLDTKVYSDPTNEFAAGDLDLYISSAISIHRIRTMTITQ